MAVKKEENVLKGSTLVDSITYELIDYCGDIKKIGRDNLRKKSVGNDVTSAIKDRYSPTFSPNNIRKIGEYAFWGTGLNKCVFLGSESV